MPVIKAPLIAEEAPQEVTWMPGQASDGSVTAHLLIQSINSTTLLILDKKGGLELAKGLREIFGEPDPPSLEIVREMPKVGEKPGPLGPFRA